MNRSCLFFIIFLFAFHFGQAQLLPEKKGEPAKASFSVEIPGMSAYTGLLQLQLKKLEAEQINSKDNQELMEQFGLYWQGGEWKVNAFLIVSEEVNLGQLAREGVQINSETGGNILTAALPVSKLEQIAALKGVEQIQIGEPTFPVLDESRSLTKADKVHQGNQLSKAYFGEGVIVGIIDLGFDYTHPNFFTDEGPGTFRIKRVWDQRAQSGTPPSGISYGKELVGQTAILNANTDFYNGSHGSHVAGIAAGSGVGNLTNLKGMAPKSDLVLVGTTMKASDIADGISYIFNYANSVNKPAVINISIGGQIGPHDGNSAFDKYLDTQVGQGKIVVGAAGNDGHNPIFIQHNHILSNKMYSFVDFPETTSLGSNGETLIDIWGDPGQDFQVAVHLYNLDINDFEDSTEYIHTSSSDVQSYTLYDDDPLFPDEMIVEMAAGYNPYTNKKNIMVYIDNTGQDDSYRYALIEVKSNSGNTYMWSGAGGAQFSNKDYNPPVKNGSSQSTIAEIGGTGKNMISTGSYTSKTTYETLGAGTQTAFWNNDYKDISPFSSKGPTIDGRTKPDITAPGNVIASSLNSFDATYHFNERHVVDAVTDGTNTWFFGTMNGTSMAAPAVTGIIALWLEAHPNLTPNQAKQIMKNSAITDNFTGNISSTGSNIWGWGKINAHQGIIDVINTLSSEVFTENSTAFYPNPTAGKVNLILDGKSVSAEVFDLNGGLLKQEILNKDSGIQAYIDLTEFEKGIYFIHLFDGKEREILKVVKK